MQEHPSSDRLDQYGRRALAPDQFLDVHRHVTACPKCSEQCSVQFHEKDLKNLISSLLPSEKDEPYHLTKSELADYANGDADEVISELAQGHLEVCDECSRAVEKLRAPVPVVPIRRFVTVPALSARIAALVLLAIGVVLIAFLFWSGRPQSTPAINQLAGGDPKAGPHENTPSPTPVPSERSGAGSPQPDERQAILNNAETSPSLRKAIELAWTNQRLERPAVLGELKDAQGRLLGEGSEGVPFRLVSPISKVVQSRTPTFVWRPLEGADAYTVLITDDKLEEVASSERLTNTRWTVSVPLMRGRTYSWQVTAFKDGQRITSPVLPAPQAKFKVLEKSRDDELKRLKQSSPNDHLGLGVFYTQVGMLDEAEQEFQALLKENPDSSAANKLLQSVQSMKR